MPNSRKTHTASVTSGGRDACSISQLTRDIATADDYAVFPELLVNFEKSCPYQIVHIGICKLDDMPVKNIIYSRAFEGHNIAVSDFSEELKWAVCNEAEALMRPFNLLTHQFTTFDTAKFEQLRALAAQVGITQIMIIPVQYENTLSIVIVNFPKSDYEAQIHSALPNIYQMISSVFTRFPTLLKWADESKLTPRETEILQLTSQGLTESQIAETLGISANTVRNHIENCKAKLDARNKLHAVALASRFKEIDPIKIN